MTAKSENKQLYLQCLINKMFDTEIQNYPPGSQIMNLEHQMLGYRSSHSKRLALGLIW